MHQQMQQFQQASVRGQQLQSEALGEAAQAQWQQNSMIQQALTPLAGVAPGAAQTATPPALQTQELATFMGSAISGTVREVGNQMAVRFQELLREAALGNQAINQEIIQGIMRYIVSLPRQSQIL